jgi:hypothetical protein
MFPEYPWGIRYPDLARYVKKLGESHSGTRCRLGRRLRIIFERVGTIEGPRSG